MRRPYARLKTNAQDVLVDEPVADRLLAADLSPCFVSDDEYPVVARTGTKPSSSRGSEYLHSFVWCFYTEIGERRALDRDEVIHHVEGHKWDARIEKLDRLPRWLHNRLHRLERQKFTPRPREDLRGFFQPQPPGAARARPDLIGQQIDRMRSDQDRDWKTGLLAEEIEAENKMAVLLFHLRQRLRHLESSRRIPKTAPREEWRGPATRMLHLSLPRLGCTPGEVALVYLMVEHDFRPDLAAQAARVHQGIIERILQRPALRNAIDRWYRYRRFPAPVPRRL